jgi:hypothetical protein
MIRGAEFPGHQVKVKFFAAWGIEKKGETETNSAPSA